MIGDPSAGAATIESGTRLSSVLSHAHTHEIVATMPVGWRHRRRSVVQG
jgi:hypothetical protein